MKAVDVIYREKVARIFASRMRGGHGRGACGYLTRLDTATRCRFTLSRKGSGK